ARLFGLAHGAPSAPPPQPAAPPPGSEMLGPGGTPLFGGPTTAGMPGAVGTVGGGGQGFSLAIAYTSTRIRPPKPGTIVLFPVAQTGQQQLNLNLSFRPTSKWQANWTTLYDLHTQQFGQHYLRLE